MAARGDDAFEYRDTGGTVQRLCPAKISDHIISPSKWPTAVTIDYLVFQNWENSKCVVCARVGTSRRKNGRVCLHEPCLREFKRQAEYCDANCIEIREAPPLGKGAFAKADIPKYQLLGEYLGELVPDDWPVDIKDGYLFTIQNEYTITARDFGNWTRFVNHHCNPNVSVAVGMYGRRRSVIFRANRDIAAGDQLFIHYGADYFEQFQIQCNCDGDIVPHDPGVSGIDFPWPPS